MKSTKLLMVLWTVCSLSGCAAIRAPNTDLCIVNAAADVQPAPKRKCYNMAKDYDDQGRLKPGAVPVYRENRSVQDLNKFLVVDSPTGTEDGQAELKAWVQKLRKHYENCQNGQ